MVGISYNQPTPNFIVVVGADQCQPAWTEPFDRLPHPLCKTTPSLIPPPPPARLFPHHARQVEGRVCLLVDGIDVVVVGVDEEGEETAEPLGVRASDIGVDREVTFIIPPIRVTSLSLEVVHNFLQPANTIEANPSCIICH